MKVDLKKELSALQKESKPDKAVEEVKLLMEGDRLEDMRILRGLGLSSENTKAEQRLGAQIELEKFNKEFMGEVYSVDQIKRLAVDYKLRFLNTSQYVGHLDIEIPAKIKQFDREITKGVATNANSLERSFFILAPPESFHLKRVREERFKSLQMDPLLFYKVDENHYRLIHKWGNDFTLYRRLLGWKWETPANKRIFWFFAVMPIVAFIWFLSVGKMGVNNTIFFLIISAISAGLSVILNSFSVRDPFDHIEGYFTPDNWRSDSRPDKIV